MYLRDWTVSSHDRRRGEPSETTGAGSRFPSMLEEKITGKKLKHSYIAAYQNRLNRERSLKEVMEVIINTKDKHSRVQNYKLK